ncbi:phosphoglycerate dehydrogenase-like enzyme [Enterococcus sp. PF1-24]|uniref:phosphoglycerate dehydrogenase n=1 Tax=unclassified Enterococcus TaxID=2608891 RepID=UPI0024752F43|nr:MULTISPECIES: phosphoglycerate dehydrogenase [unclassified Enterococcus]MDH6363613.1 phosphoglycerate dehydrogenase-like enzyme [Enterococcus sp. PFB1-1]MDH6400848.1 phosphoglycerate dehydrogenase-like enzyme [Enterococcus sp. PF1-24]
MPQPIIYLQRNFRSEFIKEISKIAPNYRIMYQLQPEELADVEISVGWNPTFATALLAADSHLKWVQAISAGVDTLPLTTFTEKNNLLSNGSGIHTLAISEHVLGVILAYYRNLITAIHAQEKQIWDREAGSFQQLAGKKALILGTGQIGQQIAQCFQAFGVSSYGVNTTGHSVPNFTATYPLPNSSAISSEVDIVINCLPLTKETTNFFDLAFFQQMKNSAMFINVGRGPSVNTADLIQALQNKQLAFAALDVFEKEPLSSDSSLWQMDNVLITPHISGISADFQRKFMDIFLPNLQSYLTEGTLVKNQVDLTKGY